MRTHPARWGSTTTLGFGPVLVCLLVAHVMFYLLGMFWWENLRLPSNVSVADWVTTAWLLCVVAVAYTVWVFAVARGWVTAATGGGFVVAAQALVLRTVVEFPRGLVLMSLEEELPLEWYATVFPIARTFGLVVFVAGLGFVAVAALSERRLRRAAPEWAITP